MLLKSKYKVKKYFKEFFNKIFFIKFASKQKYKKFSALKLKKIKDFN